MNPAIARRRHAKKLGTRSHDNGFQNQHHDRHEVNVGQTERQLSMIGGGVLAACGLLRGSLSGLALAAVGGALLWRGYSGRCEMYHMLGQSTADDARDSGQGIHHPATGRGQTVSADVPL